MDIAHQQTMDRVYRHMKHVYDATRPFFLAGRRRLRARVAATRARHVLEVGCGTARNLILLARAMPDARFVGIDISREMCAYARRQVERHGLSGRIEIVEGELSDYAAGRSPAAAPIDVVVFSFSLSMIPDWRDVLRSGVALVRPRGGRVIIADFGGCEAWPAIARRRLYKNLSYFHVFPRVGLDAELARLPGLDVRAERLLGGYGVVIEGAWR